MGEPRRARGALHAEREGGRREVEILPEPTGPGCGSARHGPCAGDNPGCGAARPRSGAETGRPAGRPQKAKPRLEEHDLQEISAEGPKKHWVVQGC
jgi:hypothetical protein